MKRFYKAVTIAPYDDGWRVLLDGRPIKTPAGRPQVVPTNQLAEALAEEWANQSDLIDPTGFVLRDLADYAIDVVGTGTGRNEVIRGLVAFAGTDTLCYQAEPDEPLRERQEQVWEVLLRAAERRWDIHFERIHGVMHRPQPAATLVRMEAVLSAESDHALAALNTLTSLTASLVIGLAALAPGADPDALWDAANLEEDWQAELWGKDAEAEALRATRLSLFTAAMLFASLTRTENNERGSQ